MAAGSGGTRRHPAARPGWRRAAGRAVARRRERGGKAARTVADDNADMREYIARLLSDEYQVESGPTGCRARSYPKIASRPRPERRDDAALDGFGLVRAIREDSGLSDSAGRPDIGARRRRGNAGCAGQGADDYLVSLSPPGNSGACWRVT